MHIKHILHLYIEEIGQFERKELVNAESEDFFQNCYGNYTFQSHLHLYCYQYFRAECFFEPPSFRICK